MPEPSIDWTDDLPREAEDAASRGQQAYETEHGVVCDYRRFALIARDASLGVVGVLSAYTAYAEIYVEDIWVEAGMRRKGIGSRLMGELEKRFSGEGYDNINLVTNGFQAAGFYRKCGFQVEFVRTNRHHPALTKTFFVKYFPDGPRTRGILSAGGG